jgi:hypothetical protein
MSIVWPQVGHSINCSPLVDRLAADDRSTSALTLLRSAMASLSAGWRRGTIRVLEVSGGEGGAVKLC